MFLRKFFVHTRIKIHDTCCKITRLSLADPEERGGGERKKGKGEERKERVGVQSLRLSFS